MPYFDPTLEQDQPWLYGGGEGFGGFELPEPETERSRRYAELLDMMARARWEANEPRGGLDAMALALRDYQPQGRPRTGWEAFGAGVLGGAARGFSNARIRSRGLDTPNMEPRMQMLRLAGLGAEHEDRGNAARERRAVAGFNARARAVPPKVAAPPQPMKLGPGEVLVDPNTGKRIAAGPPKTESPPKPIDPAKASALKARRGYAINKANRTITAIDEVLPKINALTTGIIGENAAKIPGTEAADVAAQLATIKGNIAFQALQDMREASRTGGALGQVSNIELELLSSVEGALHQRQSDKNLRQQLQKVRDSMERWKRAQEAPDDGSDDERERARAFLRGRR